MLQESFRHIGEYSGEMQALFSPSHCVALTDVVSHLPPMLAGKIGQNIKAARKARNLSLEQVAERMDPPTSYQQLSRLEKGDRSLKVEWIERIADAMGADAMELITGAAPIAPQFTLDEQVANELARTLAVVARDGEDPEPGTVQALALMLQELTATFSRHPQAYHDLKVARPVIDLTALRFDRAAS